MRAVSSLVLAATLIAGPAFAQNEPYLFDLLKKPAYRAALKKTVRASPKADFAAEVLKTNNYLAFPSKPVTIDGMAYRLVMACPNSTTCTEYGATFLFTANGGKAWVVQRNDSKSTVLGKPDKAQEAAMEAFFNE